MGEEIGTRVVGIDQKFTIDLQATPGAGYMWKITQLPAQIELLHQEIVSTSKGIGGSSTQRFTLVAHQPGTYSLHFGLERSWEKTPIQTADFSIQAR